MTNKNSFREMWSSWQGRQNYPEIFTKLIDNFAKDQTEKMRSAESCVGFGTGAGEYELQFIERCLPNIKTIIAVEQDSESAAEFQLNLSRRLPNVKGTIHQTSIQNWKGADSRVDIVLMMRVLYHIREAQRQALFQQLFDDCLAPGGYVVMIVHTRLQNPRHYAHFTTKLNPNYYYESYEDVKRDMLAAGFHLERDIEFQYERDYSNPDDGLVRLYQHIVDDTVSMEKVRQVMGEMFPEGKTDQCIHMFAVFQKPLMK